MPATPRRSRSRIAAMLTLLCSITAATPTAVAYVQRRHVEEQLATIEAEIAVLRGVIARQRAGGEV